MKFLALFLVPFLALSAVQDRSVNIKELKRAWLHYEKLSNAGSPISIKVNRHQFEGKRDWDKRWDIIQSNVDLEGKRVLNLGCGTGIACIYALKYGNAASATGVETPIKNSKKPHRAKRTYNVARRLQKAFGVNFPIYALNLNLKRYPDILGTDYDVVFLGKPLRSIGGRKRFLTYLSQFSEIIFEGTGNIDWDIDRFSSYGFSHEVIGLLPRGADRPGSKPRTLVRFYK